jgi:hypothetical protein
MVFISTPYSRYFDLGGDLLTIPVDLIEVELDCNIFDMEGNGISNFDVKE